MPAKTTEEKDSSPSNGLKDRIDQSLLQSRRLFICDGINNALAEDIIKKIWFLEHDSSGKPILLVINSPGGSVDAGFAIWDQLKMINSPITTLVTGMAASMASILMLAAAPGRCFATPKSRVMIHQPALSGVIQGQATDLEIQAREILKTKKMIVEMYVAATGKSYDVIEKAIDRDTWYSAEEAKEFGLINKIVSSYKDL
ncbi:MAG: clpP1 [Chlamydiia bacterium]|nr:clpP1 [Chlamydiia bacterium]